MAQALVIGGGIVGLCTAIRLAESGLKVTVVDDAPATGAASWGNIGHIATEQCAPLACWSTIANVPRRLFSVGGPVGLPLSAIGSWLPFGMRMIGASRKDRFEVGVHALEGLLAEALAAWRRIDKLWPGSPVLQEDGHYVVWESSWSAAQGRQAWAAAPLGTATFRDVSDQELFDISAIAPNIVPHAIRFEGTGKIVDLHQLRLNLQELLRKRGGHVLGRRVKHLALRSGSVCVAMDDGETTVPDIVVVCAGAGSSDLLSPLGHSVPLIAERGYHVEYPVSTVAPSTRPIVFEDRSVVINRFEHGLRIAGFVEFAGRATPPDTRKWQKLEKHLAQLGTAVAGEKQRWMGARPTLPDYLPAIGRSTKASNLLYAFGHQHLGLTLAPVTGEIMARLALEEITKREIEPFAIERFG